VAEYQPSRPGRFEKTDHQQKEKIGQTDDAAGTNPPHFRIPHSGNFTPSARLKRLNQAALSFKATDKQNV
jgi:hypothetical protein